MDLNEMVQKNLIEQLQKDGVQVLFDAIDAWNKRIDLEAQTRKAVEDFMERHYWENEDMKDRKDGLDYTIVAYTVNDDTGEKKDIVSISSIVEYEEEYINPAADMHNRI